MIKTRISSSFLFVKILITTLLLGFVGVQFFYFSILSIVGAIVIYGLFWLYLYVSLVKVEFDLLNLYVKVWGEGVITVEWSDVQGIYSIASSSRSNQGKMTIIYLQNGHKRSIKFSPRILTGAIDEFRAMLEIKNHKAKIDMCWPYS